MSATTQQQSILDAAAKYHAQGYPLDSVYMDMSSWDASADFQLNGQQFPDVTTLVKTLHNNKQRLVSYIDAGVNVNDRAKNPAYQNGQKVSAFIKTSINNGTGDGNLENVKNGKNTVYVDWFNEKAATFWGQSVTGYQKNVNFDGLWTTMNEPYGEVAGEIPQTQSAPVQTPRELLAAIKSQSLEARVGGDESPYDQSWFYSFWPLNDISTYFLPFIPELQSMGNYDNFTISLNGT